MDQTFQNNLIELLESKYHGDAELLFSDLKNYIQEYRDIQIKNKRIFEGEPLIQLKNVSKTYKINKEAINAVKNVDIRIYEGEMVALVGPSGSGKSTVLQLIGGLDKPTSGEIVVNKVPLQNMNDNSLSDYRNNTVGFVFQFFYLQPYLNVQQNVEIPLIFRSHPATNRENLSLQAVQAVGLEDRKNHLPNQLSGGQTQRVAIARAIVGSPKILLADEPTANLDRDTSREIIDLMRKINRELGTTVIIVTHDHFIASKADRIIKLSDGKVL